MGFCTNWVAFCGFSASLFQAEVGRDKDFWMDFIACRRWGRDIEMAKNASFKGHRAIGYSL